MYHPALRAPPELFGTSSPLEGIVAANAQKEALYPVAKLV